MQSKFTIHVTQSLKSICYACLVLQKILIFPNAAHATDLANIVQRHKKGCGKATNYKRICGEVSSSLLRLLLTRQQASCTCGMSGQCFRSLSLSQSKGKYNCNCVSEDTGPLPLCFCICSLCTSITGFPSFPTTRWREQ